MPHSAPDKAPGALFASPGTAAAFTAAGLVLAAFGLFLWWRDGPGLFLDMMLAGIALCA